MSNYLRKKADLGPRTSLLVSKIATVSHILVASELEAFLLEANLIKKHKPPFNVRWTDGKAYPFIKVTVKDRYPAVLQARKIDDLKAVFFGPFPNIGDVRRILRWVRKIFPYQSVRNHPKKICLYYHLGLCPCPPVFNDARSRRIYRRNIRYLIDFLAGKKENVVKKLGSEMLQAAKREDFEEAGKVKKQLDTIERITSGFRSPAAYVENPNLLTDEAEFDLTSLAHLLGEQGITIHSLSRIECYDISNIQGEEATGSMVVATDGQMDTSQYRRFKIKSVEDRPDDVIMMKEMFMRRMKHPEWLPPHLIVVDGGKPQVNAVSETLHDQYTGIPVIGLAKRLEEIYVKQKNTFSVVRLPSNHRALKLLQRLRDEAHRFALAYYRKLHRKKLFSLS